MNETGFETCSNCNYTLLERSAYCPYCGAQLTHPVWKKVGAWILLVLIAYGLVRCHLSLLDGFGDRPAAEVPEKVGILNSGFWPLNSGESSPVRAGSHGAV